MIYYSTIPRPGAYARAGGYFCGIFSNFVTVHGYAVHSNKMHTKCVFNAFWRTAVSQNRIESDFDFAEYGL